MEIRRFTYPKFCKASYLYEQFENPIFFKTINIEIETIDARIKTYEIKKSMGQYSIVCKKNNFSNFLYNNSSCLLHVEILYRNLFITIISI